MHKGEGFSTKNVLKKLFFVVKMTCPAMVRSANSDFWKALCASVRSHLSFSDLFWSLVRNFSRSKVRFPDLEVSCDWSTLFPIFLLLEPK